MTGPVDDMNFSSGAGGPSGRRSEIAEASEMSDSGDNPRLGPATHGHGGPLSGPLDVALSGGGTRAALFSAGALLALIEAHSDDVVQIERIRAVSGSSLLVARLATAGERYLSSKPSERVDAIRAEIAGIIGNGFAFSPLLELVITGLLGSASYYVIIDWWFRRADQSLPPTWLILIIGFLIAFTAYQTTRRKYPFSLNRCRWFPFRRSATRVQRREFSMNLLRESSLLPTHDLGFICTELPTGEVRCLKPAQITSGRLTQSKGGELSVYDAARASAAYPVFAASVSFGNAVLADGGIVDNLAVSEFGRPPVPAASTVVVVDANTISEHPPGSAGGADSPAISRSALLATDITVPLVILLVALGIVAIWPNPTPNVVATVAIVFWLAILRFLIGIGRGLLGSDLASIRDDFRAVNAVTSANGRSGIAALRAAGRKVLYIRLVDISGFGKEPELLRSRLKTTLAPLRRRTAARLVRESYSFTVGALGRQEDPSTMSIVSVRQRRIPHFALRLRSWGRRVGRIVVGI